MDLIKLADVKEGDTVVSCRGRDSRAVMAVEAATATQITVGGRRYIRRSGLAVGSGQSWNPPRVVEYSPEYEDSIKAYEAARDKYSDLLKGLTALHNDCVKREPGALEAYTARYAEIGEGEAEKDAAEKRHSEVSHEYYRSLR